MKKIIITLSYFLVFIVVFATSTFANIQEEIRNYLREWHNHIGNRTEIARQLGVSSNCIKNFIQINSTTDSPKIVGHFRDKFPGIYSGFLKSLESRPAFVPHVLTPTTPMHLNIIPTERPKDNLLTFPLLPTHSPFVVAHPNAGPISVTPHSLNDPYIRRGVQVFHKQPLLFLPNLSLSEIYARDISGGLILKNIGERSRPFEIRIFGPDSQNRFGWVVKARDPIECFAYAIKSEEPRLGLPVAYPVGCGADGSHLFDRFHTPHPKALFNSNKDPINFVAEEPVLNENVRKGLTQEMGYIAYRQMYIRDKNAPTLPLRRRLEFHKKRNRWSTFEDGEVAVVPTSSIFLGIQSVVTQTGQSFVGRVYYLPENNLNPGGSIYKRYYDEAKRHNHNATYKSCVIPRFEIQNAAHLFLPLVFDERKTVLEREIEFYRTFYMGINLFPFVSFSEILSFLNRLNIPFSWNGAREYTAEQLKRITHQIHTAVIAKRVATLDKDLKSKQPFWNNFRLPSCLNANRLQWEDAEDTLIPIFPNALADSDVARFLRYVSASLLEQAIKSPLATSKMRLRVAENYIKENELEKATDVLQLAFHQIDREGTIGEGLWLLKLYIESLVKSGNLGRLDEQQTIVSTRALIEGKRTHATLEDLIKLKQFNEKRKGSITPFDDGLRYVKKITGDNCRIIKDGNLLPEKVCKLERILSISHLIEEFSLQDAVLSTRDCSVTVAWTEDDSIEDHVSPEEYFWEYEKPLFKIMKGLEKHAMSLKKLNFRNLAFGLFNEEESRVSCWFDAANVIKMLCSVSLPELEELHVTGILQNSNEDAIILFENLHHYFPKLQKLYLSLDAQKEEYELTPATFPKMARLFRGIREDEFAF